MSRATSAVDMWLRMAPACAAQAAASWSSDLRWTRSSSGVTGNGNGGRVEIASSKVSKQRSGVL
jgi:hypothetical protein